MATKKKSAAGSPVTSSSKKTAPAAQTTSPGSGAGKQPKSAAKANRAAGGKTAVTGKSPAQKTAGELPKKVAPSGKADTNFFDQVYDVARQIPRGRVTSYGAIAASLGAKSSSRMVGWAMNSCRSARPKVPAHRVVNRMGILSGKHHFEDPLQMEKMLAKEGVKVKADQVVDFKKVFWDPSTELGF
ncbi:MAG: MGMT family protein [Chitinophagaceae bacterium]|nr:MAG: MGMT family protein [Chitinophagaceae bacterium]